MIGSVECGFRSIEAISEAVKHPASFFKKSLSPRTQLALRVANSLVFPEAKVHPEIYRLVSNLIYFANNFFDVGLRAQEQTHQNKQSQFLALETVYHETHGSMVQAADELTRVRPDLKELVENFIIDGIRLYENKKHLSPVAYREIDSGVAAILVFGVVIGEGRLKNLLPICNQSCANAWDLQKKYTLFRISDIKSETLPQNLILRTVIGMQAVEMLLAILDDQWGKDEDILLGIPSTNTPEVNRDVLKAHYKDIAQKCGISSVVLKVATSLAHTHKLKARSLKSGQPIELHDIDHHSNIGQIFLLREWLRKHTLLEEMLRNT